MIDFDNFLRFDPKKVKKWWQLFEISMNSPPKLHFHDTKLIINSISTK